MKLIVFILTVFASSVSFGLEGLSGHWCQHHPVTNEVTFRLEVNSEGDYQLFEQNEGGAVLQLSSSGFISQGASAAVMQTSQGQDLELVEILISSSIVKGKSITFIHADHNVSYQECP